MSPFRREKQEARVWGRVGVRKSSPDRSCNLSLGHFSSLMQQFLSVTTKMSLTHGLCVPWGTDCLHKKVCSLLDNPKTTIPECVLKRVTCF